VIIGRFLDGGGGEEQENSNISRWGAGGEAIIGSLNRANPGPSYEILVRGNESQLTKIQPYYSDVRHSD
jgi:hypothetical protein